MNNVDPTYVGAYGKIKSYSTDFLPQEIINRAFEAKDLDEIISTLYSTFYRQDFDLFSTVSKGAELLSNGLNHRLVLRNRIALMGAPAPGREILRAYLSKWDIENIKIILSSKYMGYSLKETENYILSFRDIPLGIFGGRLTQSDFRSLLSQGSIDSIVNYLSNYGYGQILLEQMEKYRRINDISILLSTLDKYYFTNLLASVRYYNGDEGPVFRFFRELIDAKNIMTIMKGKTMGVDYQRFSDSLIPGGNSSIGSLEDLFLSTDPNEALQRFSIPEQARDKISKISGSGKLQIIESAILSSIHSSYMEKFQNLALSIGYTFSFIMRSERERENLRSAIFGNIYNISKERIAGLIY